MAIIDDRPLSLPPETSALARELADRDGLTADQVVAVALRAYASVFGLKMVSASDHRAMAAAHFDAIRSKAAAAMVLPKATGLETEDDILAEAVRATRSGRGAKATTTRSSTRKR